MENTFYTTREGIPQDCLDLLIKIPEDLSIKAQLNKDIPRTTFNVGTSKYQPPDDDKSGFESTQEAIAKIAQEQFKQMTAEDVKYFSSLMTHLSHQGFANYLVMPYVSPRIKNDDPNSFSRPHTNMYINLNCIDNKPYVSFDVGISVVEGEADVGKERKFSYKFFADKTMQLSMENYDDKDKEFFEDTFKLITSKDDAAKKEYLTSIGGDDVYKENDPYSLLVMNCDQEKCKIVTRLVALGKNPEEIKNEEIDQIYAIEKLSKADPYTVARMVHKYIEDNPDRDLKLSNDLYSNLSPEAQAKISEIANAMEYRKDANGLVLGIKDLANIIVDYFLSIFKSFELKLGESAVTSKEFDEFCGKLSTADAQEKKSTFAEKYLELKKHGQNHQR